MHTVGFLQILNMFLFDTIKILCKIVLIDNVFTLWRFTRCFKEKGIKLGNKGNSLAVQWLGLYASIAEGTGSIPGRRAKILQAVQCDEKKKKGNKVSETI